MSTAKPATIKKFLEITSITSHSVAKFFLERHNNRVTQAINDYYNNTNLANEIIQKENNASTGSAIISPQLRSVFNTYKDPNLDGIGNPFIGIDGTLKYLEDLGLEPEDVVVLALAEFLESPGEGVFKQDQFLTNWSNVRCNTIADQRDYVNRVLKSKLNNDKEYYKKVYQYTYKFVLERDQKNLPLDTAIAYWNLILPTELQQQLNKFIEYLKETEVEAIKKDEWNMLYPFLQDYAEDPTLENYDIEQSWPVLMDEFFDWLEEKGQMEE
ncbi:unnamed protein product [Ambrosiozyma monospora]|uniref:Defective in cullin neddylation protein n=1 Tax=Ambrosiozyma monospora TaxID=43982 RepID=A0A9W6YSW8_AMBMO|nr:unnamed protein product [Ambrosiozyma monospora]